MKLLVITEFPQYTSIDTKSWSVHDEDSFLLEKETIKNCLIEHEINVFVGSGYIKFSEYDTDLKPYLKVLSIDNDFYDSLKISLGLEGGICSFKTIFECSLSTFDLEDYYEN